MAFDFVVPNLGEGVENADVSNILVKVGDKVVAEQELVEVETGKAAMPIPVPVSGVVKEVQIAEGDSVAIGQVIMVIDQEGGAVSEAPTAEATPEPEPAPAPAPQPTPTPKPAPAAPPRPKAPPKVAVKQTATLEAPPQLAPASPAVRRFAREIGVDISKVSGTGNNGRISNDDVKAYAKKLNSRLEDAPSGKVAERPLPDFSKFGEVEYQQMSNIRAAAATHLSYAFHVIPHVTQYDEADITAFEEQRKRFQIRVDKQGGSKLTVTALLLKIVAFALKRFPKFNASVDMPNQSVYYKGYVNIGIAVDTPRGLVVPVIRDVDEKNMIELTNELTEISTKARNGRITLDDMQGGCFTISNLGGIGGTHFTPIINWPEVAILGVSRSAFQPTWNKETEQFDPRLMMPLCLSYDHRLIDGADSARFLRWICEAMENPMLVLLET